MPIGAEARLSGARPPLSKGVPTGGRVLDEDAEIHSHPMRIARLAAASAFRRASGFVWEMRLERMPVERVIDVTPAVVVETNVKRKSRVTAASDR
uniref:Uncharacterized protein n=1 Tax=Burkholderia cenocepacia TaxID=95486 RepID=A0A071MAX2_9BURK